MRPSRKCMCLLALFFLLALGGFSFGEASAAVDGSMYAGPPQITTAEPPAMVVIPNSRVYFVPEAGDVDLFFYDGYWWSPRGDRWYQSRHYNYGWIAVNPASVPGSVIYVPRNYRDVYGQERRIPYGQWKSNYHLWERERMESHRRWEMERESEWRLRGRHDRYDRDGYGHRDGHRGGHHDGRGDRDRHSGGGSGRRGHR